MEIVSLSHLSLPETLSAAENIGYLPDGEKREIPVHVRIDITRRGQKIRADGIFGDHSERKPMPWLGQKAARHLGTHSGLLDFTSIGEIDLVINHTTDRLCIPKTLSAVDRGCS